MAKDAEGNEIVEIPQEQKEEKKEEQKDNLAFTDLTDAELDAKLAEASGEKKEEKKEEKPPEKAPEKKEEQVEKKGGEEEKKPGPAGEKKAEPTDTEKLLQRIADLEKKTTQQEEFIKHQGTEIGDLRKRETEKFNKEFSEKHPDMDPDAIREVQRHEDQLADEEDRARDAAVADNRAFIRGKVPEIDNLLPEMAALLKDDGIAQNLIDGFTADPWINSADFMINLAKRAQTVKELAETKKKLEAVKDKPEEVARKIEEAARKSPPITGKSGGAGTDQAAIEAIATKDVTQLSDAELEKALAEADKK